MVSKLFYCNHPGELENEPHPHNATTFSLPRRPTRIISGPFSPYNNYSAQLTTTSQVISGVLLFIDCIECATRRSYIAVCFEPTNNFHSILPTPALLCSSSSTSKCHHPSVCVTVSWFYYAGPRADSICMNKCDTGQFACAKSSSCLLLIVFSYTPPTAAATSSNHSQVE